MGYFIALVLIIAVFWELAEANTRDAVREIAAAREAVIEKMFAVIHEKHKPPCKKYRAIRRERYRA